MLVFVYGTLKSGRANHAVLAGARRVADAITAERYALRLAGLPMLDRDDPVSHVHGELYEVDDALLARLDAFEEHPEVYRREEVTVLDDRGMRWTAWAYFHRSPHGELLPDGRY